jgi:hypothetical protein
MYAVQRKEIEKSAKDCGDAKNVATKRPSQTVLGTYD